MPILLLIGLIIACLPIDWPRPPWGFDRWQSALLTGGSDILLLLLAFICSRRAISGLRRQTSNRFIIARRYSLARTILSFLGLANFAAALLLFGWGWASRKICETVDADGPNYAPGTELLTLAPFFITLLGGWFIFYDADREFHRDTIDPSRQRPYWSRGGYILFHFRQSMIFFLPLVLLIAQAGLARSFPKLMESDLVLTISVFTVPLVVLFLPLLLPLILGLKRLPPGPYRERLEAGAHRLGLRYREIMLWDTHGGTANALVAGLLPSVRFLVFTDRLLTDLREEEIEAVLGHEAGHVRHRHIPYYSLFLLLSCVFILGLVGSLQKSGEFPDECSLVSPNFWAILPYAATGVYLFLGFGFLSRKCERQADLYGCRAVSCLLGASCQGHDTLTRLAIAGNGLCPTGIETFINALERVETINGMTRPRLKIIGWIRAWQHGTIPNRVRYLQGVAEDLRKEAFFQWWIYLLRWAIVLVLGGGIVTLGLRYGWGIFMT